MAQQQKVCSNKHLKLLGLALENKRKKQIDTDIILLCQRGDIHAHKVVLTAACPYFDKIILSEVNLPKVDVNWCSYEIMNIIVNYLYTGEAQLNSLSYENLELLMEKCEKMKIGDLLAFCWENITERYTDVDRFAEIWHLGIKYRMIHDFAKYDIRSVLIGSFKAFKPDNAQNAASSSFVFTSQKK